MDEWMEKEKERESGDKEMKWKARRQSVNYQSSEGGRTFFPPSLIGSNWIDLIDSNEVKHDRVVRGTGVQGETKEVK